MLKGSTDFYTSRSKFDNEEVKSSIKASSDISTPQAQFPTVRNAETVAEEMAQNRGFRRTLVSTKASDWPTSAHNFEKKSHATFCLG